jgi:hypothetical protein
LPPPLSQWVQSRPVHTGSIFDNLSWHAGHVDRPARRLMGEPAPIHLAVHNSWLNQVKLRFSIVQRKALTPNDCGSMEQLAGRLLAFDRRYREVAEPFEWTSTRADLERVLARVDAQRPGASDSTARAIPTVHRSAARAHHPEAGDAPTAPSSRRGRGRHGRGSPQMVATADAAAAPRVSAGAAQTALVATIFASRLVARAGRDATETPRTYGRHH